MIGFNPLNAQFDDWVDFLVWDTNSHTPDYKAGARTPLETAIKTVNDASLDEALHQKIAETCVEAALEWWDGLAVYEVSFATGGVHPFRALPRLAYQGDTAVQSVMNIMQRLWHDAPRAFTPLDPAFIKLFDGFGEHVPLENELIVELFIKHFETYHYRALDTLLRRKKIARVSHLFQRHVTEFNLEVDPHYLNRLVALGLPVADAKLWLDKSINAEPGYEGHYKDALERWTRYSEQLTV